MVFILFRENICIVNLPPPPPPSLIVTIVFHSNPLISRGGAPEYVYMERDSFWLNVLIALHQVVFLPHGLTMFSGRGEKR